MEFIQWIDLKGLTFLFKDIGKFAHFPFEFIIGDCAMIKRLAAFPVVKNRKEKEEKRRGKINKLEVISYYFCKRICFFKVHLQCVDSRLSNPQCINRWQFNPLDCFIPFADHQT